MAKQRRRRRRLNVLVPLTSMGDIAFLLIIFFILCSNFAREPSVELDPAESMTLEELQQGKVLVSIDKDGQLWLDKYKVADADQLEEALPGYYAERGLDPETDEDLKVYLKPDRDTPFEVYQPVMAAITNTGVGLVLVGELSPESDY